ncbi:hypothetical protein M514_20936 [Trichuris suis]|uniref:Uncharacterized protein n=1 Tax=Trichuris suis TaxID=68888 RepID=A0A085NBE6_9BILA|nr:hypothetical protein M514_20936 [Trichuris suis]
MPLFNIRQDKPIAGNKIWHSKMQRRPKN